MLAMVAQLRALCGAIDKAIHHARHRYFARSEGKDIQSVLYGETCWRGHRLGLSISHDVVKQHGGAIDVDTQPGVFTKITVIVPCAAVVS
jgi:signal transduction histidine kinase